MKPLFLRRALGLHTLSYNVYIYLLTDTQLFIENHQHLFDLSKTPAYLESIRQREAQMVEVDHELLAISSILHKRNHRQRIHMWCSLAQHMAFIVPYVLMNLSRELHFCTSRNATVRDIT